MGSFFKSLPRPFNKIIKTLCQGQWPRGTWENVQIKVAFLFEKSVTFTPSGNNGKGVVLFAGFGQSSCRMENKRCWKEWDAAEGEFRECGIETKALPATRGMYVWGSSKELHIILWLAVLTNHKPLFEWDVIPYTYSIVYECLKWHIYNCMKDWLPSA